MSAETLRRCDRCGLLGCQACVRQYRACIVELEQQLDEWKQPRTGRMVSIDELIVELQKTREQFGNTCVYIRDLSWGAVAMNREADDKQQAEGRPKSDIHIRAEEMAGQIDRLVQTNVERLEKIGKLQDGCDEMQKSIEWLNDQLQLALKPAVELTQERDALKEKYEALIRVDEYVSRGEIEKLKRERDEARGKAAYVMEAFWLAIADLDHSDECDMATCDHRIECPHMFTDCTCPEKACECTCSCWRSAADKVGSTEEALQLCTKLRDAEDQIELFEETLKWYAKASPLDRDDDGGVRARATLGVE